MKIGIIGGGFTGLAAAWTLTRQGHSVTVYEKEPYLGGLAYGFKKASWDWHIEAAYHHLFTNDTAILTLIKNLGRSGDLLITRPVTATLWNGRMYQLDSPMHLLTFPALSPADKFRTAVLLAGLKLSPFWKPLEQVTAERLLVSVGGTRAWTTIWEPLLYGKFGDLAPRVAASWFWARIKKRTPRLCYIRGGFHTLVTAIESDISKGGGTIRTGVAVSEVKKSGHGLAVRVGSSATRYDAVLLTVPTPFAAKLAPELPAHYLSRLLPVPHQFAQTLILETDRPILDRVYWLNVTDRSYPFLAAVAHTNFMDSSKYGNRHLTYFGNYLPPGHPYLSFTREQLLKEFRPYISKLSRGFARTRITDSFLFTAPFAQPVHELGYSGRVPPINTPVAGLYCANMDYVVPWDRGTNYAVELGNRAAEEILARQS